MADVTYEIRRYDERPARNADHRWRQRVGIFVLRRDLVNANADRLWRRCQLAGEHSRVVTSTRYIRTFPKRGRLLSDAANAAAAVSTITTWASIRTGVRSILEQGGGRSGLGKYREQSC